MSDRKYWSSDSCSTIGDESPLGNAGFPGRRSRPRPRQSSAYNGRCTHLAFAAIIPTRAPEPSAVNKSATGPRRYSEAFRPLRRRTRRAMLKRNRTCEVNVRLRGPLMSGSNSFSIRLERTLYAGNSRCPRAPRCALQSARAKLPKASRTAWHNSRHLQAVSGTERAIRILLSIKRAGPGGCAEGRLARTAGLAWPAGLQPGLAVPITRSYHVYKGEKPTVGDRRAVCALLCTLAADTLGVRSVASCRWCFGMAHDDSIHQINLRPSPVHTAAGICSMTAVLQGTLSVARIAVALSRCRSLQHPNYHPR